MEWVKTSPRNEALDCEVYCYAAAIRAGINRMDFESFEKALLHQKEDPSRANKKPVARPVVRSRWMMSR